MKKIIAAFVFSVIGSTPSLAQLYAGPTQARPETDWIMVISPLSIPGGASNVAPVYFDTQKDCQAVAAQIGNGSAARCIQARIVVLPQFKPGQ